MREYSDNAEKEFPEVFRRENSGEPIEIIAEVIAGDISTRYHITGKIGKINFCRLCFEKAKINAEGIKDKILKQKLEEKTEIALGDGIVCIKFLGKNPYDCSIDRIKYHEEAKKNLKTIKGYLDYLFG